MQGYKSSHNRLIIKFLIFKDHEFTVSIATNFYYHDPRDIKHDIRDGVLNIMLLLQAYVLKLLCFDINILMDNVKEKEYPIDPVEIDKNIVNIRYSESYEIKKSRIKNPADF